MLYLKQAIDEPKTMMKVGSENVDHKPEQSTMEKKITKNISSEGMVTAKCSTKLSFDEEELEKLPESDSIDRSEINDGGKTVPDKANDMKEPTDAELQEPKIKSNNVMKIMHPSLLEFPNMICIQEANKND